MSLPIIEPPPLGHPPLAKDPSGPLLPETLPALPEPVKQAPAQQVVGVWAEARRSRAWTGL